jgi:hypothetical protein
VPRNVVLVRLLFCFVIVRTLRGRVRKKGRCCCVCSWVSLHHRSNEAKFKRDGEREEPIGHPMPGVRFSTSAPMQGLYRQRFLGVLWCGWCYGGTGYPCMCVYVVQSDQHKRCGFVCLHENARGACLRIRGASLSCFSFWLFASSRLLCIHVAALFPFSHFILLTPRALALLHFCLPAAQKKPSHPAFLLLLETFGEKGPSRPSSGCTPTLFFTFLFTSLVFFF